MGFSLLEVSLALMLFTFAYPGFFNCQFKLSQQLQETRNEQVALQQILSLIERFKANKNQFFRDKEWAVWQHENAIFLPYGKGTIKQENEKWIISLAWGKVRQHSKEAVISNRNISA